jgi:hypothetical protein
LFDEPNVDEERAVAKAGTSTPLAGEAATSCAHVEALGVGKGLHELARAVKPKLR